MNKLEHYLDTNHPNASQEHRAAFLNTVHYLTTGEAGVYGGPSIREHIACALWQPVLELSDAIDKAASIVFADLDAWQLAETYSNEHCFDDDASDLERVRIYLSKRPMTHTGHLRCSICYKSLHPAAKRPYCVEHRSFDPEYLERMRNLQKRRRKS